MFDRLFFVLFNIQPKPLAYTRTIDVYGDRYTIHSQKPVTITEKDSGYIQIKALGKMHIFLWENAAYQRKEKYHFSDYWLVERQKSNI